MNFRIFCLAIVVFSMECLGSDFDIQTFMQTNTNAAELDQDQVRTQYDYLISGDWPKQFEAIKYFKLNAPEVLALNLTALHGSARREANNVLISYKGNNPVIMSTLLDELRVRSIWLLRDGDYFRDEERSGVRFVRERLIASIEVNSGVSAKGLDQDNPQQVKEYIKHVERKMILSSANWTIISDPSTISAKLGSRNISERIQALESIGALHDKKNIPILIDFLF